MKKIFLAFVLLGGSQFAAAHHKTGLVIQPKPNVQTEEPFTTPPGPTAPVIKK